MIFIGTVLAQHTRLTYFVFYCSVHNWHWSISPLPWLYCLRQFLTLRQASRQQSNKNSVTCVSQKGVSLNRTVQWDFLPAVFFIIWTCLGHWQWSQLFLTLVKISLSYSHLSLKKTDPPGYHTLVSWTNFKNSIFSPLFVECESTFIFVTLSL